MGPGGAWDTDVDASCVGDSDDDCVGDKVSVVGVVLGESV